MTISELARACSTSETTLVRFGRALGFAGYAALKLQMAAELASESAQLGAENSYGSDIGPADTLAEMVAKISGSELFGIRETAADLDLDVLQCVIDAGAGAQRAVIFGVAASNVGARNLKEKLLRIGRVALSFADAHDAVSSASLLGSRDVAITNAPNSPITREADLTLLTSVRETTFRSGAMASRIAQLTIVDYVFVGVARTALEASVEALRTSRESLGRLRGDKAGGHQRGG